VRALVALVRAEARAPVRAEERGLLALVRAEMPALAAAVRSARRALDFARWAVDFRLFTR
jgi:uncharacterized heparinase superfamily protein